MVVGEYADGYGFPLFIIATGIYAIETIVHIALKYELITPLLDFDFLGWINFSDHKVLRTAAKRRMMRRITESPTPETLNSYLGLLGHGNARELQKGIYERTNVL